MAFNYNGNVPKKITYNSNNVKKLVYNGTTVWTASTPYYAIQNGSLVNCPNASSGCTGDGGWGHSSGTIAEDGYSFYGGVGGGGGSGYIGGVSSGGMQSGVQSGNGKAKITLV